MKKNVIFISISLGLIILLGIGFSYSMWNISVSQDTTNLAESKCFDLSITNKENNISLDNAYPISNDKGKSLTPFTFTVTNTCDITAQYNINLEVLNTSTLSSKFIDVMLENNDIKEINLLSNFDNVDKVNTSSIESRKLTTGILKSQESKNYSLRLWIDYNTTLEDLNNEIKTFKSKIVVVGKPINFNYAGDMVFNFDYTGGEQTFIAPISGTYRLETWGAQGGNAILDGNELENIFYGGYSNGQINLQKDSQIFVSVGGKGNIGVVGNQSLGGWNGGGNGDWDHTDDEACGGGGGATSIQDILIDDGQLKNYENNKSAVLMVAGGSSGMGASPTEISSAANAGMYLSSGGGYLGGACVKIKPEVWEICSEKANQANGYLFGQGGSAPELDRSFNQEIPGGGGGYYGGYTLMSNDISSGYAWSTSGGGSGYIGNSLLKEKVMYCYNCEESNEESTKTISTTCNEETPTSYCAKKGNGYARITLVSID